MKNFFLMLCFLWVAMTANAQFSILGKVHDESGNPLSQASVYLKKSYFGTSTRPDGSFKLRNLPEGNYTLVVSYLSFKTQEKTLSLQKNEVIDFVLEPAEFLAEEIVIMGTRAGDQSPVTRTLVTKDVILSKNLGQDIPFLLQQTPSLVTTSDAGTGIGYTGLRVRGTDATRINVTINGIPLNDAESHGVFWVDLPDFSSSLEDVQIQRGVGTSTNGSSAFGASINMQTQALQKEAFAKAGISAGSFGTFKQTYSAGTGLMHKKFQTDARFSKLQSNGFIDRATADLESYYFSGAYFGEKNIVKLLAFSGKEKTYQAWDGISSEILKSNRKYNGQGAYTDDNGDLQYYDNQTDNYEQTHLQLLYSTQFSEKLNGNVGLHYTKGKGYYESYRTGKKYTDYALQSPVVNDSVFKRTDLIDQKWLDNDFWGATFSLQYHPEKLTLIIGGGWNKYYGRHFGKVIWAKNGFIPSGHEWYQNVGQKMEFNSYAKMNYQLTDKLSLYADMQYRYINYKIEGIDDDLRNIGQKHDFNFFNPKAGLFFAIDEQQQLYLSFAQANREPNRNNFVDANPNAPLPKQEKLNNWEAGYELKKHHYRLGTNLFFMKYNDQLVLTGEINDVGEAVMTNVENSYRTGIELVGGIKFLRKLKWEGNVAFSQNKIKDFSVFIDDWDTGIQHEEKFGNSDLSFSPEIVANSTFSYNPAKNLSIDFMSHYVGKQYIDNTANENRRLNAYFVNNININYELKTNLFKEISFKLLINNIFNEKYESNAWVYRYFWEGTEQKLDGYFPQAGTHFLAGMTVKF